MELDFYSIFILLHSLSASVGIGTVIGTDYIFFRFLKDYRISEKEVSFMKLLSQLIWIALAGLVLTGSFLLFNNTGLLSSPKFLLKMTVVTMIFINGLVLNLFITPRLTRITFFEGKSEPADAPDRVRKIANACGAISLFSWLTAFFLGSISSIPFSYVEGISYYFGILALLVLIASFTKRKKV